MGKVSRFANVHESARLKGKVIVGDHAKVGPYCLLNGGGGKIMIGRWTNLTYNVTMHGRIDVGNFCLFAGEVFVIQKNHNTKRPSICSYMYRNLLGKHAGLKSKGTVKIGHDVWVGQRAVILPGADIGNGCIIGAGAVVAGKIPDYSVVVGNPGLVVKKRFSDRTIRMLRQMRWFEWSDEEIRGNRQFFMRELQ